MSQDPLDYQVLLQDALRGLVRRSLEIVAEQGFTGEHHFYLAFRTGAPGVVMPDHLRDSYPDEMTIVLKTQFKDLTVDDDAFSVGLYFASVLYYLTVPFSALSTFTDPSASFQLMFQPPADEEEAPVVPEDAADAGADDAAPGAGNVVAFDRRRR